MTFLLLYWRYIALAALLGGLAIAYNVHVDGLIKVKVDERDRQWQASEKAGIAKAKADAAATEAAHAIDLKIIAAQHDKEIADAKLKHDKDVADARSGALRLRIPANCPSGPNVPGATSPAAGGDGAKTVELPREVTAGLYSLADDADAIVSQLTACQAVITSDRKGNP